MKEAVRLLAGAWQIGLLLPELPAHCRPRNAAEAYRIQDLLAEELDFPVGGWKIGCTSAEIVDSRFSDWLKAGVQSVIADQGSNGALILGPAVPRWRQLKLDQMPVKMLVNGKIVGQGAGADCLGHPLKALTWLANLLRKRGGLASGAIVSTGTCCGFHRAAPGDSARAEFGRIGGVEVTFARSAVAA
jgi:2-keto-4-pentenoate hydratase